MGRGLPSCGGNAPRAQKRCDPGGMRRASAASRGTEKARSARVSGAGGAPLLPSLRVLCAARPHDRSHPRARLRRRGRGGLLGRGANRPGTPAAGRRAAARACAQGRGDARQPRGRARAASSPGSGSRRVAARAVLEDDVTLIAGRVRARLDPLSLALGRLGIADLRLDDVIVLFPPRPTSNPSATTSTKHDAPHRGRRASSCASIPAASPTSRCAGSRCWCRATGSSTCCSRRATGSLACAGLRRERSRARARRPRAARALATFPARFALE